VPDKTTPPDAIDAAIDTARAQGRNILNMQLDERGRVAMMIVPQDMTPAEALMILGTLPGWMVAAMADYSRKTAGGRIQLLPGSKLT
jgi:hypothetical protein